MYGIMHLVAVVKLPSVIVCHVEGICINFEQKAFVEIMVLTISPSLPGGPNQNVTIKPYGNSSTHQTLGHSKNFVFICSSSTDNVIDLQILGPGNKTKLEKVSQNHTTSDTIFTYNITDYKDDQTTFRCRVGNLSSPDLVLTIFCE